MSFHWSLSSEDEFEEDETKFAPATATASLPSAKDDSSLKRSVFASSTFQIESSNDDDDDSFSDNVDWQDVEEDESSPKTVVIDLEAKPKAIDKKKKRKAKRVYRYKSLPPSLQTVLINMCQAHLLTLTSRATLLSLTCSHPELLHVVHSLLPPVAVQSRAPSLAELGEFSDWFFQLVNHTAQRRQRIEAANVMEGAPRRRQRRRHSRRSLTMPSNAKSRQGPGRTAPEHLIELCEYLSPANDENPQLVQTEPSMSHSDKAQLLVAAARSLGWRARLVTSLHPMKLDLDADHPFFVTGLKNVFETVLQSNATGEKKLKKRKRQVKQPDGSEVETSTDALNNEAMMSELLWVEILSARQNDEGFQWIHVDPGRELLNDPHAVETLSTKSRRKRTTIPYALASEHYDDGTKHRLRLTDVTPRYAKSWSNTLKQRVANHKWWEETIRKVNRMHRKSKPGLKDGGKSARRPSIDSDAKMPAKGSRDDAIAIEDSTDNQNPTDGSDEDSDDHDEQKELRDSAQNEAIPTSKRAFQTHPVYALGSLLTTRQVLAPDAKQRVCGVFKGELVYRRADVSTARTAKQWLYKGRQVVSTSKPVKRLPAKKKGSSRSFKALQTYGVGASNDGSNKAKEKDMERASVPLEEYNGMDDLFGVWQTQPWSPPPVGPQDEIPVNEHKNVEVELLNPGLCHLVEPRMSVVAKQLNIPYAPALIGFEGHGGARTPSIKGIVVHEHNRELLREAYTEFQSKMVEDEIDTHQQEVRKKWKKLIVGLLTKDRLERDYGSQEE